MEMDQATPYRARPGLAFACAVSLLFGCGGMSAETRGGSEAATSRDSAPPWVWVDAPSWDEDWGPASTEEGTCGTSGNVRFCRTDNGFREEAIDVELGTLRWLARDGTHHYFRDAEGGVFSATSFSAPLRRIGSNIVPVERRPRLGESGVVSIVDQEGRVWLASGDSMESRVFAGRAYDAYFATPQSGSVLVEPGDVYESSDGGQTFNLEARPPVPRTALPRRTIQHAATYPTLAQAWLGDVAFGRGVTLPDVGHAMIAARLRPIANRSVSATSMGRGWVFASAHSGTSYVKFDSERDETVPWKAAVASFDGTTWLAPGHCGPQPAGDDGDVACLVREGAQELVALPRAAFAAGHLALEGDSLIVGGPDCPPQMCAGAPFVRVEFDSLGNWNATPISIHGAPPSAAVAPSPGDRPRFRNSDWAPAHDAVRLRWTGAERDVLLKGPTEGPWVTRPLPDTRGQLAFADAQHGVFRSAAGTWVTADAGESWTGPVRRVAPSSTDDDGAPLRCSSVACRVGRFYWLASHAARRLRFPRGNRRIRGAPAEEHTRPRSEPPLAPPVRRHETLLPLDAAPWAGFRFATMDGAATIDDRPPGPPEWTWRGRGAPEGASVRFTAPHLNRFADWELLAAAPQLVVFRNTWNRPRGEAVELQVLTSQGTHAVHRIEATMRESDPSTLSLRSSSGGFTVAIQGTHRTALLQLDARGQRVGTRVYGTTRDHRHEYVVVRNEEAGLLLPSLSGAMTFYGVHGTEAVVRPFVSPTAACVTDARATDEALVAVSRWGSSSDSTERWIVSEHSGAEACWRSVISKGGWQSRGRLIVEATPAGQRAAWYASHNTTPLLMGDSHVPSLPVRIDVEGGIGLHAQDRLLYAWTGRGHLLSGVFVTDLTGEGHELREVELPVEVIQSRRVSGSLRHGILRSDERLFRAHDQRLELFEPAPGRVVSAAEGPHGWSTLTRAEGRSRARWHGPSGRIWDRVVPPMEAGGITASWLTDSGTSLVRYGFALHHRAGIVPLERWELTQRGRLVKSAETDIPHPTGGGLSSPRANRDGTYFAMRTRGAGEIHFLRLHRHAFVEAAAPIPTAAEAPLITAFATPSETPIIAWRDVPVDAVDAPEDERPEFLRVASFDGDHWREIVAPRLAPHSSQVAVHITEQARIFLLEITDSLALSELVGGEWREIASLSADERERPRVPHRP